jgi:hypothetical protein
MGIGVYMADPYSWLLTTDIQTYVYGMQMTRFEVVRGYDIEVESIETAPTPGLNEY